MMRSLPVLCLFLATLSACSGGIRSYEKTVTRATDLQQESRLARSVRRLGNPGDGRSGVRLISNGEEALAARLLIASRAERSIDAQYYLLHDDPTGHIFAASLLEAADRGVRVRLLLDDMYNAGYDPMTAALDQHPNIEIRLFNPVWRDRGRIRAGLTDFKRINRRMHNKSMTSDNAVTIVGGRNIGAEYFLAKKEMNYADLDVLAVGPVVDQVSNSFDQYWNSRAAVPAKVVIGEPAAYGIEDARARLLELVDQAKQTPYAKALVRKGKSSFSKDSFSLSWVPAQLYADHPSKVAGAESEDPVLASQLIPYFEAAENDVQVISGYFVPRSSGVKWMTELENRGVDVRVITNSLGSNDVDLVYAHYAKKRKSLLRGGVELYELRPDLNFVQHRGSAWEHSRSGLHSKAFAIDDRYLFIGSFNWDPRSVNINTEMGILIDSPPLTKKAMQAVNGVLDANTFHVQLSKAEILTWTTQREDGVMLRYNSEPTGKFWDHLWTGFLGILPIGSQL